MTRRTNERKQSGQAMIFVVMVVVVLAFVVLWNFDVHKTLFVKVRTRDAGDAAALAAARWQGASLNIIGDLNIVQAALLSEALAMGDTEFPEVEALHELRSRLNFVGPVIGMVAAQQAAKNNGIFVNSEYTDMLLAHARMVRNEYIVRFRPPWRSPDANRTAWDDYADMLMAVASNGVAVMPDNPSWFTDFADHNHFLLNPSFYDAVASRNWCWFYFNAMGLLEGYVDWRSWAPLPFLIQREPVNSELFSLRLRELTTASNVAVLNSGHGRQRVGDWVSHVRDLSGRSVDPDVLFLEVDWHMYDTSAWTDWTAYIPQGFPFETAVRAEYNVLGADAAVRLETEASRVTPGIGRSTVRWTAAAKPFGLLPGKERIDSLGMVLPGFSDVRLVPVDTSTAPESGSREGWGIHIYEHLPIYLDQGPRSLNPRCFYCRQLLVWENIEFRQQGLQWLQLYSRTCHVTVGGPGPAPATGGTRRGH